MRNSTYIDLPVGHGELRDLQAVAKDEEIDFFTRNPRLLPMYRDRLICIALCQGAALQYTRHGHGVKDFDIHLFYLQNLQKPRLSRAVRRIHANIGAFSNIQVDFVRTVVPCKAANQQQNCVEQIRQFLSSAHTRNAAHLARQPVIGLRPEELFGVIIWNSPGPGNSRADKIKKLSKGYAEMAADTAQEREAEEWCEGLVSDVASER